MFCGSHTRMRLYVEWKSFGLFVRLFVCYSYGEKILYLCTTSFDLSIGNYMIGITTCNKRFIRWRDDVFVSGLSQLKKLEFEGERLRNLSTLVFISSVDHIYTNSPFDWYKRKHTKLMLFAVRTFLLSYIQCISALLCFDLLQFYCKMRFVQTIGLTDERKTDYSRNRFPKRSV